MSIELDIEIARMLEHARGLAAKAEEPGLATLEAHIQDRLPKPLDGQESRHRVNLLLRIARA